MLLQVTADPVTSVELVGCVERAGVTATTHIHTHTKLQSMKKHTHTLLSEEQWTDLLSPEPGPEGSWRYR